MQRTFVVYRPDQEAKTLANEPGVYEKLDKDFNGFKDHSLVSCYSFDGDWSSWEMHPKGDELVVLLSGAVTFVLRSDGRDREVALGEPGDFAIVPKGTWHTAKVESSATVLFFTPGEDTRHSPA